jgi:hypothetical protein
MTADAPRVHIYGRAGAEDFMLGYGPKDGPQLIVLQPLFEEMNRCRALVAGLCRALAAEGVGCWLPDLPGSGESPRALEAIGWTDWQAAVLAGSALIRAETGAKPASIALRGGALLDTAVPGPHWRLSPVPGASLLTDLRRSALAGEGTGYTINPTLAQAIETVTLDDSAARTVRVTSETRPADLHVDGTPLWRRSEPGTDAGLLTVLTSDIVAWVRP